MLLDVLVTVLRHTKGARGSFNEPEVTWPEAGKVYAAEMPVSSDETAAVGQEMAFERASLRMRRNSLTDAMTTRDRLSFRGATWEIAGKRSAGGSRRAFYHVDVLRRIDTDRDEE
ncbi:head-tail adaptor protein [Chachezhania sediminis]|uniref:head-tail adaptor protein n=1 Tax=Chachezhania sediminis TaxID=2599291 RepID=UPI00131A95D3|nr:head-tail adaptor protein [Chachezhania sediminis]